MAACSSERNMLQCCIKESSLYHQFCCVEHAWLCVPLHTAAASLLRATASVCCLQDPLYQAWLSSIETVPSAGLGAEYWNTPSKFLAYSFLGVVALVAAAVFTHA